MGLLNKLSEEKRKSIIDELILYFEQERDEKVGMIAAGQLLDFFMQSAGSEIYNKGISDAKKVIESRINEISYDLDDLLEI